MNQLTILSNDADQLMFVQLDDGSIAQLEFICRPAIQRWSLSVVHPNLVVNNIELAVFPNILRQWRNLIPFGMAVTSIDGVDPIDINDFINGRVQVYVLNADDVLNVESQIMGAAA